VAIELDANKLSNNYKIKPAVGIFDVADQRERRSEAEEKITGPIKNLNKYIIAIWIDKKEYNRINKVNPKLLKHPKIKRGLP
jgi:hypothetical protein